MSEAADVRSLPFRGTTHGVISHFVERKDEIAEIYAVLKLKNGDSYECIVGDNGGLAFAIIQLQHFAIQQLERQ